MKKIVIQRLRYLNFKGIRDLEIQFTHETTISGKNGVCKTSTADGFQWLLFGKNSDGRKDFNVKTLDENNEPIHRLSHEIEGDLLIGDKQVTLKRVLTEKWTRRRGSGEEVLDGNETTCFINGVCVSVSEYEKYVDTICPEQVFKLLTNPLAFPSLDWKEQRKVLIEMAGGVNPRVICVGNNDFLDLIERMSGYTEDNYKKLVASRKNKSKEELEKMPSRIDEVKRMIPEVKDWASIRFEIEKKEALLSDLNNQLNSALALSSAENEKALAVSKNILRLRGLLQEIEQADKDKAMQKYYKELETYRQQKSEYDKTADVINNHTELIEKLTSEKSILQSELDALTETWRKINAETLIFPDGAFMCPVCKQLLPEEQREEKQAALTEQFNKSKSERLKSNIESGTTKSKRIKEINEILEEPFSITLGERPVEPSKPEYVFTPTDEYKTIQQQIEDIQNPTQSTVDEKESQLRKDISDTNDSLKMLRLSLQDEETHKKCTSRLSELFEQEKNLAQAVAKEEQEEQLILDYSKLIMSYVETSVSSMFKIVKFRLYKNLINGGTEETCEAMVNGVPFSSDLNSAMRVGAGIDIINAISRHMGISAPIWIDNRESVIDIPSTESQIINLVVDKTKNTLTIE